MKRNNSIRCVTYSPWDWVSMQTGVQRRFAIIDHIMIMKWMYVNRKNCPQIHEDVDLKKLLKNGTLIQSRSGGTSRTHTGWTILLLGKRKEINE